MPWLWLALLFGADVQPKPLAPPAFLELEPHSPAVRDGHLVEDVGLETLGGVFTVLLSRDQALPAAKTETFTTAADGQRQVEVRVFRGVAKLARDNTRIGRFAVDGIPAAPRGTVTVEVTFSVTADGAITVRARERAGRRVGLHLIAGPGIQSFDCTSDDEMKRGESLRARRSGGPEGATWNWYGADLLCTVVVRGACDGTARVALELGRKQAARGEMTLSERDPTSQELRVPAKAWERALQRRRDRVFETLPVSIRIDARCSASARRSAPQSWADAFVGAFSGGE
jgi:hypothetical protein